MSVFAIVVDDRCEAAIFTAFLVVWVVSSYLIFRGQYVQNADLRRCIAELKAVRPDIQLNADESYFGPPLGRPSPFPGIGKGREGFDEQGIPQWGSLNARVEIGNPGRESGKLVWRLDRSQTQLPAMFDLQKQKIDFYAPSEIDARGETAGEVCFGVMLSDRNPSAFAAALKVLGETDARYRIVIAYWTSNVDGESGHRELSIEGDFSYFREKVVEHWQNHGFRDLVNLVE